MASEKKLVTCKRPSVCPPVHAFLDVSTLESVYGFFASPHHDDTVEKNVIFFQDNRCYSSLWESEEKLPPRGHTQEKHNLNLW